MPRLLGRGLLRSTLHVSVGSGLANAAMGAVAILTARHLGPDGRGFLVVVVTLCSFCTLVFALGTNLSLRVLLADPRRLVTLNDSLGLALVLILGQAIVTAAAGALVLPLAGISWSALDGALVGGYGAVLLASVLSREALVAIGRPQRAVAAEAKGALGLVGVVALLIATGQTSPRAYLTLLALGALAQAILAYVALGRDGDPLRPAFRPRRWRRLVGAGLPGVGLSVGQAVALKSDRLLLGILLSPAVVGVYSVAATLTELFWIAPVALAHVLVRPVAAQEMTYERVAAARNAALAAVAAAGIVAAAAAPAIVRLLVGDPYAAAVSPLRILLLGAVIVTSYHVDVTALAATGAIPEASVTAMTGAVVAVCAGLLVIPRHGVVAAAWVSDGAYLIMAGMARAQLRVALSPRRRVVEPVA